MFWSCTGVRVPPSLPVKEEAILKGKVYVQKFGLGFASYHFDTEENVYISYSAFPSNIVLDNNKAFPRTKNFINIEFDYDNRIFIGTIDWSSPEGTTVNGAERWVYRMVFNNQYTKIESGTSESYDANSNLMATYIFGTDLIYSLND